MTIKILLIVACSSLFGVIILEILKSNFSPSLELLTPILNIIVVVLMIITILYGIEQGKTLKTQLQMASRVSLFKLGEQCMWTASHGGDYDSYLVLQEMFVDPRYENIKDSIKNQIDRVKYRYKASDMMIEKARRQQAIIENGKVMEEKDITTDVIFSHIIRSFPSEQIRSAYLMGKLKDNDLDGRSWEEVFDKLIWAMNNDAWCLYGRWMALWSYSQLSGFELDSNNPFNFTGAKEHWEKFKESEEFKNFTRP